MRRCYVGLFNSPATYDNFNGTLVRIELDKKSGKGPGESDREAFLAAGVRAGCDYYCAHAVECAVRPDVELKSLLAAVSAVLRAPNVKSNSLRYAFLHRSHALMTRQPPSAAAATEGAAYVPDSQWDVVDVQVCVSRELRQRVLLLQFLKALPAAAEKGTSLGGLLLSQFSGSLSVPLRPIEECPKIKRFLSYVKVTSSSSSSSSLCRRRIEHVSALQGRVDLAGPAAQLALLRAAAVGLRAATGGGRRLLSDHAAPTRRRQGRGRTVA